MAEALRRVIFAASGRSHVAILEALSALAGLAALAVPIVLLARGYAQVDHAVRLRLRWVFLSTLTLIPLFVGNVAEQLLRARHGAARADTMLPVLKTLLTLFTLSLYVFVVLRQRLVEIRIVVNRALVFAVFIGFVVGLFALMESVIERRAISQGGGLALEIVVRLFLGVFFHRLARRLEPLIDRLFFRQAHEARAILEDFARDAAYATSPEVLVQRAVRLLARHGGGGSAVIYEADDDGMFRRRAQEPVTAPYPLLLDRDDPALARRRATRGAIDFHGRGGRLVDGLLVPFVLVGRLTSGVALGSRAGGRYVRKEIDFLTRVVSEIGTALFALRACSTEEKLRMLEGGGTVTAAGAS